jgi:hypothetical protein
VGALRCSAVQGLRQSYSSFIPPLGSTRSSARSSYEREFQLSGYESIPGDDSIHLFPQSRHTDIARVDTGGTGSLTGQEDDNEEQTEARKEPEPKFESEPGDTSTSQVDGEGDGNFDLVDNLLMQWTNLSKDEYMALQEVVALESVVPVTPRGQVSSY